MKVMARRLLTAAIVAAILMLSGSALARPDREQPRRHGISAYVMTVLDMFQGGIRGAMISLFARGEAVKILDPIEKEEPGTGKEGGEEVMALIP